MSAHPPGLYKVVVLKPSMVGMIRAEDVEEALNKHGALGWELVHPHQPPMSAACAVPEEAEMSAVRSHSRRRPVL